MLKECYNINWYPKLKLKGQKSKEGEIQLERPLNVKVDVVSDRAIREELKDEILKEAILIWKETTLFF